MNKKIAVVALGGNALLRGNEVGTIQQQEKNTYNTCIHLLKLINSGYELIITHGNGPQVGNIMLRNEAGYKEYKIPQMPLDICVADSQGGIGYMIERQIRNILRENRIRKNVVTVITQVIVDKNDPAFEDPTKPVGGFYLKEEAELLARSGGFIFKEDSRKRGWRRVVPSPEPKEIVNKKVILDLVKRGNIVIASGGGGIPVYRSGDKGLVGVEAVIDKDLASALLASEVGAESLFILTDVSNVYLNFNKHNQTRLEKITVKEAEDYLEAGEFADGSMRPKILAAIKFVNDGGKETIITESTELANPDAGTRIASDNLTGLFK